MATPPRAKQELRFAACAHARLPESEVASRHDLGEYGKRRVCRQQGTKRALLAARRALPAPILSRIHNQRVKFVEQFRLRAESNASKKRADFFIIRLAIGDPVTPENPVRVGIHHEDGMISGIQQDGVGGFRPDAVDGQKFFAQLRSGRLEHALQRTPVLSLQEIERRLSVFSLFAGNSPTAAPARQAAQFARCSIAEGVSIRAARKIGDGALDISPRGALGQDRPHDHFEWRLGRPPVHRAKRPRHRFIVAQ